MIYVVQTEGLLKKFKERVAVADLNLEVREGEVFGLVGPNGAGKSTTINMLLGLVAPTSGSISLLQTEVPREMAKIRGRVGALLEKPGFIPTISARKNLACLYLASGQRPDYSRIDSLLDLVGISNRRDDTVGGFSQGLKQRLGLAAALLNDPDLLILDEPHTGLDPTGYMDLRDLILELKQKGKTLFLSSHQLSEVEEACSSFGFMQEGQLVAVLNADDLRERASSTKVLIADVRSASDICRARGWSVRPIEAGLEVLGATRDEVRDALVSHGLTPISVSAMGRPLEEMYREITSRKIEK